MSHRAALYTVKVRKRRDTSGDHRLLGDIDEAGTSLLSVLESYFTNFVATNVDQTKVVRSVQCDVDGNEVRLVTQHGQNGVAAEIVGPGGQLRHRQTPDETQLLRCGCLFLLPPAKNLGWLAVHVNNGRGVKGLLDKGLRDRMRVDYPDLILDITPYVETSVLMSAVDNDQIDKVKLVKYEKPNDRAMAATDDWVPAGVAGRLELDISARGKGTRIIADRLRRFLGGEAAAFNEIVEFQGLTFDEAKVEVVLDGEVKRSFNIEKPDTGHAFTENIEVLTMEDGEFSIDSVFDGLRSALGNVAT